MIKALSKNKPLAITVSLLIVILGIVLFLTVFGKSDEQQSTTTDQESDSSQEATPSQTDETLTDEPVSQTATYAVEYNVTWSNDSHPETLPSGAHVSPIVLTVHKTRDSLFEPDHLATAGIEIMAETGATATLVDELSQNEATLEPVIGQVINAPGSNNLEIKANQDYRFLSAVSMLAPSPDWFVAVNNVELFKDGQWLDQVELTMRPYDAGTDSGATFEATNSDTNPAEVISLPRDDDFKQAAAEGDFATITIKLQK